MVPKRVSVFFSLEVFRASRRQIFSSLSVLLFRNGFFFSSFTQTQGRDDGRSWVGRKVGNCIFFFRCFVGIWVKIEGVAGSQRGDLK